MSQEDERLVERAVSRDPHACAAFVHRFSPIIRHRVARALRAHAAKHGRSMRRADLLDLSQEIFLLLLDRDARVLRTWDGARGLSLDNFVGLVAEREASSILRSGRRSAWAEQPTAYDDLSVHARSDNLERDVASRQQLDQVLDGLRESLTPTGHAMFEALFLDECSIEEVATRFATTPNALYTFRSRLRRELARIHGEPMSTELSSGGQT